MPSARGTARAQGKTLEEVAKDRLIQCYVCHEPLTGMVQRDYEGEHQRGAVIGDRHRTCEPSPEAKSGKKAWISGQIAIRDDD